MTDATTDEIVEQPEVVEEQATAPEPEQTTDTGAIEADAGPAEHQETEPQAKDRKGLIEALRAERAKRQEYEQFVEEMRAHDRAPAPPQQPQGEPKLEQFSDYGDYQRALARYEAQQVWQQQAQQARIQQAVTGFQSRVDTATDRPEDYSERIAALMADQRAPISPAMAEIILEDDTGPDLAYYLASHPAEMSRLARLSPVRQVAELGKLSAKLANRPVAKPSGAPPPINPVKGAAATVTRDPDQMPLDEWMAWRRKQVSSKR